MIILMMINALFSIYDSTQEGVFFCVCPKEWELIIE